MLPIFKERKAIRATRTTCHRKGPLRVSESSESNPLYEAMIKAPAG